MSRRNVVLWLAKKRRSVRLILLVLASMAWLVFAWAVLAHRTSLMRIFFILFAVLCFVGLMIHLVKAKY
jgi:hypothetical protein